MAPWLDLVALWLIAERLHERGRGATRGFMATSRKPRSSKSRAPEQRSEVPATTGSAIIPAVAWTDEARALVHPRRSSPPHTAPVKASRTEVAAALASHWAESSVYWERGGKRAREP